MKDQIKELRVKIDGLAQLTAGLLPVENMKVISGVIPYTNNPLPKLLFTARSEEEQKKDGYDDRVMIVNINENSKEIEKAIDSLYLAKAWLGKVLQELGEGNPYGSGYKTVQDIVPTQDVFEDGYGMQITKFNEMNHIEKVDWLRTEIGIVVQSIRNFNWFVGNGTMNELHFDLVYKYLCEARMWLGFELGRIKEEK